ncbi:MAG TPA: cytochrome c biogenesis protein CcdA, partial [Spirochaetia bacterium]|nr:cytochrome c biogenesis protein CcdA [Spirochaetia bacterium]
LLSFLSPCILPLIPSYLSYIGGVTLAELRDSESPKSAVVVRTVLFVFGFSVVFILLGVLFSGTGFLFSGASALINLVAGLVVVLLGLNMVFDFWKFLNIERRVHFSGRPAGYLGSAAIGMAFGAGWTPCVGPILAGILFLAGNSGSVGLGILFLSAYSLGLGVPFLLASIFFRQVTAQLTRIKRHFGTIRITSGILLVAVGLLIAFGRLQQFNNAVVSIGVGVQAWHQHAPLTARIVLALATLFLGLLFLIPGTTALLRYRSSADRTDNAPPPRFITPVRGVFLSLFAVAALLQLTGVISLESIIFRWLTFQGI